MQRSYGCRLEHVCGNKADIRNVFSQQQQSHSDQYICPAGTGNEVATSQTKTCKTRTLQLEMYSVLCTYLIQCSAVSVEEHPQALLQQLSGLLLAHGVVLLIGIPQQGLGGRGGGKRIGRID